MPTLVLTAAGSAIGGPVGGAIGALLGNQVDRRLLGATRQGARLADLKVQTSAYGSDLPKLFGTLRVAGTVIWATDLREERHVSGGGKSGAKTASYTYSASFAVALSGRPIRDVGRIWADGALLRGGGGDWKGQTGFRLYTGGEDQPIDPLIASAEGIDACPAHRGTAYAVFEDMQLADYGNRLPQLTFEVVADDAPVEIGRIAAVLAGDGVAPGDAAQALAGYAAAGDSVRGALEALAAACPLSVVDDGMVLRIGGTGAAGPTLALDPDELGASADGKAVAARTIERAAVGALPDEVAIAYYEPARDYQAGLQRARRGGPAVRARQVELAAALSAEEARGLAEAGLRRAWRERAQATVRLPWARMGIAPGQAVTLPGDPARWRVTRLALEEMVAVATLVRAEDAPGAVPIPASAGRATIAADLAVGTTIVRLIDLPPIDGVRDDVPRLWVAAAGSGAGWRRAALSVSLDDGASWQAIGSTAAPAVLGAATTVLAAGDPALADRVHQVTVQLAHDGMALANAGEAALDGGANAALLGDELIQFGQAVQIGAGRWRLGRLRRGRRGTEAAVAGHAIGDGFVLVERAALLPIDLSAAMIGRAVRVSALGLADGEAAVESVAITAGRAVRPPAPVRLRIAAVPGGAIGFRWTRRSRTGWDWINGTDAPLGEEGERYRVAIALGGVVVRTAEVGGPAFDYAPADRAADGAGPGAVLAVSVRQIGAIGQSDPLTRTFIIGETIS